MVKPLEKSLDEKILAEMESGYSFEQVGDYESAEQHYLTAWELFPEPKFEWDSSQIRIYNIVDFYLGWKKYGEAERWAKQVFKTNPLPRDGTPYICLGKVYYEFGKMDLAFDNFKKAYLLAGKRAFQGEDKKYLDFYKKRAAGG